MALSRLFTQRVVIQSQQTRLVVSTWATSQKYASTKTTIPKNPKKAAAPVLEEPKKPRTDWQIFLMNCINEEKAKDSSIKMTEISKIAGEKWRALSEKEKKAYTDKYQMEKNSYEKARAEWLNNLPPSYIAKENARRRYARSQGTHTAYLHDPKAPKRSKNGFMFYVQTVRNNPAQQVYSKDMTVTEQSKLLGARWNAMSPEEKKPFTEMATKDMARFKEEADAYNKMLEKTE